MTCSLASGRPRVRSLALAMALQLGHGRKKHLVDRFLMVFDRFDGPRFWSFAILFNGLVFGSSALLEG